MKKTILTFTAMVALMLLQGCEFSTIDFYCCNKTADTIYVYLDGRLSDPLNSVNSNYLAETLAKLPPDGIIQKSVDEDSFFGSGHIEYISIIQQSTLKDHTIDEILQWQLYKEYGFTAVQLRHMEYMFVLKEEDL